LRKRATTFLLVASLVLNALGVVLLVFFFKLQSSYKSVVSEKQVLQQNLAATQAGALPTDAVGSQQVSKRNFISHVDGLEDTYSVLAPSMAGRLDYILVVYLHGMGSNSMEPFLYPSGESISTAIAKRYPNVCLLSCSYRKEQSWGSDAAMSDITQNIREVMQQYPIKQIVLMGTSMGGCTALSYGVSAPDDIKSKLSGIVSVEGAGDLGALYSKTSNPQVRAAMEAAMGGSFASAPQEYKRKSFIPNIDKLPKSARVAVISATQDTIVPVELQAQIVQELQAKGYSVTRIDVDAPHGAPPAPNYIKGLEFALAK
jgi:pimeloyl-ACP methyl ester carboxylesterase